MKNNIPVSCSQQQITDRHVESQEHSSHRHNKNDIREMNIIDGVNSQKTPVSDGIIKLF